MKNTIKNHFYDKQNMIDLQKEYNKLKMDFEVKFIMFNLNFFLIFK